MPSPDHTPDAAGAGAGNPTDAAAGIGISYAAQVVPSPLDVTIRPALHGGAVDGVLEEVGSFTVLLTPDGGNLEEEILSGIAEPLAQTLALLLPPLGHQLLNGLGFTLAHLPPLTHTIGGEQITLTLKDPGLSRYQGMLQVTATPVLG
ncbi:hypothetical protein ACFVGY_15750 [Streptomyces sp. NPDC127106]|uniref:hypothetical protein n=1 Tax=Streptomyces sp. NPDC127106 TaxID=3345360 RepID=UPI0036256113